MLASTGEPPRNRDSVSKLSMLIAAVTELSGRSETIR